MVHGWNTLGRDPRRHIQAVRASVRRAGSARVAAYPREPLPEWISLAEESRRIVLEPLYQQVKTDLN